MVEAVIKDRQDGKVHPDTDAILNLLVELQVRGRRLPLPFMSDSLLVGKRQKAKPKYTEDSDLGSILDSDDSDAPKRRRRKKKEVDSDSDKTPTTMADMAIEWFEALDKRQRNRRAISRFTALVCSPSHLVEFFK